MVAPSARWAPVPSLLPLVLSEVAIHAHLLHLNDLQHVAELVITILCVHSHVVALGKIDDGCQSCTAASLHLPVVPYNIVEHTILVVVFEHQCG